MSSYVIRVELHYATSEDYEKLHRAMELAGFAKTIVSGDGIRYELPPATYYHPETLQVLSQVHGKARAAANSTGKLNEVVVTDSKGVMFSGLRPVQSTANALLRRFG